MSDEIELALREKELSVGVLRAEVERLEAELRDETLRLEKAERAASLEERLLAAEKVRQQELRSGWKGR